MTIKSRAGCADAGHCWHEPDGTSYQRHNQRPEGDVRVTCCYCGEIKTLPMFANHTAPGLPMTTVEHGKAL